MPIGVGTGISPTLGGVVLPTWTYVIGGNLALAGDVDAAVRVQSGMNTQSAFTELVSDRSGTTGEFAFRIASPNLLNVLHWEAGAARTQDFGTFPAGALWARAVRDVDGGTAGAPLYTVYYSTDITNDPDAVTWTMLGSPTTVGLTAPTASTTTTKIGGPTVTFKGRILRARIKGAAGAIIADFESVLMGHSGYTDAYGVTWTPFTA